ncbi:hypothetical protein BDN71DRAFT_1435900, partial [Pleurotus eryngii]
MLENTVSDNNAMFPYIIRVNLAEPLNRAHFLEFHYPPIDPCSTLNSLSRVYLFDLYILNPVTHQSSSANISLRLRSQLPSRSVHIRSEPTHLSRLRERRRPLTPLPFVRAELSLGCTAGRPMLRIRPNINRVARDYSEGYGRHFCYTLNDNDPRATPFPSQADFGSVLQDRWRADTEVCMAALRGLFTELPLDELQGQLSSRIEPRIDPSGSSPSAADGAAETHDQQPFPLLARPLTGSHPVYPRPLSRRLVTNAIGWVSSPWPTIKLPLDELLAQSQPASNRSESAPRDNRHLSERGSQAFSVARFAESLAMPLSTATNHGNDDERHAT